MSMLISVGILASLALWGFGCNWASQSRFRQPAPLRSPARKARAAHGAAALMLLLSAAMAHLASAQTPAASPARDTPLAASTATGVSPLLRYAGAAVQGSGKRKTGSVPVTEFMKAEEAPNGLQAARLKNLAGSGP